MELDLRLKGLQTGLFLRSIDMSKKLKLAQDVISASGSLLDADPVLLPIPESAPPEFPRLIFRNESGNVSFNLSLNRANFGMNYEADGSVFPDQGVFEQYVSSLISVTRLIVESYNASFKRIGFVLDLFSRLQRSSNILIKDTFLKGGYFDNAYQIELNTLHQLTLVNFQANRWLRLKSLRSISDPSDDLAVQILLDINTIPEEIYDIGIAEIEGFCREAYLLANENVREFFG